MGELVVRRREEQGGVVVEVEGDLDPESADMMLHTLLRSQPRDGGALVVDLSRVHRCDPAAVAALVRARQATVRDGGRFVLLAPSHPVARSLRITGLARNLEICSTRHAALLRPGGAGLPRQRSGTGQAGQDAADLRGANTANARG